MLIIEKPYISAFLLETIKTNNLPVLQNEFSEIYKNEIGHCILTEEKFISKYRNSENPRLYTTSENSIGWIINNLGFSELPGKINLFKDKVRFRKLIEPMYPDFFYKEISINDFDSVSINDLPLPFIIKPSTGFFSMGVYKVNNAGEWNLVKKNILSDIEEIKNLYPVEVLDINTFIIEECIEGDEFASDAYFDDLGNPVLLNTFKHYFASSEDVSDRVYYTSKDIIQSQLSAFTEFLTNIGELTKVKNFPVHVEVRVNKDGLPVPIEINPLRFGGWCTTADLTFHAYRFNPYEYFMMSKKPDWSSILSDTNDSLYSIIVLNNSTGTDTQKIQSFDYELLSSAFSRVIELRKINFKEYPVFGFLFTENAEKYFNELEKISASTLNEYVHV